MASTTAVRRAELVACISLATDLGVGQPIEHGLRGCLMTLRLGRAAGLSPDELADAYDLALLRWIGCTSDAHELSALVGDELDARARWLVMDGTLVERGALVSRLLAAEAGGAERMRGANRDRAGLRAGIDATVRAWGDAGRALAAALGFPVSVQLGLSQVVAERWDGSGAPEQLAGEAILRSVRVVGVACDAEIFHRLGGPDEARAAVRRRRGSQYDPGVADVFCALGDDAYPDPALDDLFQAVLDAEPVARSALREAELDAALAAVGDLADLKSPCFAGHSRRVSELAAAAAQACRLPAGEAGLVRHAALVQELGRLAVPNSVWDKPAALTAGERERVRLHPYVSERSFARSTALAPLGTLAGLHHERLDGSGYHRGLRGRDLGAPARILQAADAYAALRAFRPHRPALAADEAAGVLRGEVRSGRLDGEAVDAVLAAAGHPARGRRRDWPAGLTAREVEVLRLVAEGHSNPQIAAVLHVSRKTAAHHVEHIYAKIGVSTRAGAALFAMRHSLLADAG